MFAVVLGLAACGGDKTTETDAKAGGGASSQTVTVATATLQTVDRMVTASGTISAWEEVPVGAETGGLVATGVYVDEGAWVRQGQVLVKLNDALLRAQLRQQDAAVSSAEANAAREDADLGRAHELKDRGFLSQASLTWPWPSSAPPRPSWPLPGPAAPKLRPVWPRPRSAPPSPVA